MDDSYAAPLRFATALDELHELVAREVGTADFGDNSYLPGLNVLLQSMDYDPHFTERGRRIAWGTVVGVLRGRAQALQSMRERAETLEDRLDYLAALAERRLFVEAEAELEQLRLDYPDALDWSSFHGGLREIRMAPTDDGY